MEEMLYVSGIGRVDVRVPSDQGTGCRRYRGRSLCRGGHSIRRDARLDQKSIGLLLNLYYTGRLDGRSPKLDIEALLSAQIAKMTEADYTAEAMRCEQNLQAKGAQITHFGEDMQKYFNARQK